MIEINTIYNESCIDTISRIPNQAVHLTLTSPPYNMRLRIRNGKYTVREKAEHFSKKYTHFSDDLYPDDFYSFHKQVLTELLRVSKIVCYNFQIVTGSKDSFFKLIGDFHNYIKDIAIWDKGHGQPAMNCGVLNSAYEYILILEQDGLSGRTIKNHTFKRGTLSNIWRIKRESKIKSHNASFPISLAHLIIQNFSSKGDLIYDPFCGTGTTPLAAKQLNRKYIASEIIKEYCDITHERLSQSYIL
jgi:site-specific DNA-methyltransferase (adenine-specific)